MSFIFRVQGATCELCLAPSLSETEIRDVYSSVVSVVLSSSSTDSSSVVVTTVPSSS